MVPPIAPLAAAVRELNVLLRKLSPVDDCRLESWHGCSVCKGVKFGRGSGAGRSATTGDDINDDSEPIFSKESLRMPFFKLLSRFKGDEFRPPDAAVRLAGWCCWMLVVLVVYISTEGKVMGMVSDFNASESSSYSVNRWSENKSLSALCDGCCRKISSSYCDTCEGKVWSPKSPWLAAGDPVNSRCIRDGGVNELAVSVRAAVAAASSGSGGRSASDSEYASVEAAAGDWGRGPGNSIPSGTMPRPLMKNDVSVFGQEESRRFEELYVHKIDQDEDR